MNYKINTIPRFEKDVKKLKKNFPKIKNDLIEVINKLSSNPKLGITLGENIFKIRIPNSSVPTGKSGGFRIITYYKNNNTLYLVTIYSKSKQDNILTTKLKQIIQEEIINKF
jgi:mRNA-degrading endonuclease RelE of RelBE toxin-antitoxin system